VAKDIIYFGFRQGESRLETRPKNQREVVADKQQRQKDSREKAKIKFGKQHNDNIFEDTPSKDRTFYLFLL
jgi:hypothetical protein